MAINGCEGKAINTEYISYIQLCLVVTQVRGKAEDEDR